MKKLFSLPVLLALVSCGSATGCWPEEAAEPPIHVVLDLHMDPMPQVSLDEKRAIYENWVENANWLLDTVGPLGVKVSFLSAGEFMEFVSDGGAEGEGAALLRRIYANGGQVGSHSHREHAAGAHSWPSFSNEATLAQARRSWSDNVAFVNRAIETALGNPPPEALADINTVKGAHLPTSGEDYARLMDEFGFGVRQGGPEEDIYALFSHYIMNPFRPSADSAMAEDLSSPFVAIPAGPVLGIDQIHHGIHQDFTLPAAKALFLQEYLNWRYRVRAKAEDRVWVFGFATHGSDIFEGSVTRAAIADLTAWLADEFVERVDDQGNVIASFATQTEVGEAYEAWEGGHPGTSSFSYASSEVDWDLYPYLRSVGEELAGGHHVEELALGPDVAAHRFDAGGRTVVAAWRESGESVLDITAWIGGAARVVGAETGALQGTDPAHVVVGTEPVLVVED